MIFHIKDEIRREWEWSLTSHQGHKQLIIYL